MNDFLAVSDVAFYPRRLAVEIKGREIHLTMSEMRLLVAFLDDPDSALSMEFLMAKIWHEGERTRTARNGFYNLIFRVRKKLSGKYIFQRDGGYSFLEAKK